MADVETYPFQLGDFHRAVTIPTDISAEKQHAAQLWFDRGMVWCFGFHHEEAIACFQRAVDVAPRFAMAHWGNAYCHAPNYNFHEDNGYYELSKQETGFPSQKLGFEAIQSAVRFMREGELSAVECALINAMAIRFTFPGNEFARHLNRVYATAMGDVYERFPGDMEVVCLYSEALMCLRPWRLWECSTAAEEQEVQEICTVLQAGLKAQPTHPGLCHLYVHLMEMSDSPEAALPAADHLRVYSPDVPHLCHMPSHIDVLVGNYYTGILANAQAVRADLKLKENNAHAGADSFYLGYVVHDYHMLVYAALFCGVFTQAEQIARDMVTVHLPDSAFHGSPLFAQWFDMFVPVRLHVLIRFGKWKEILSEPFPEDRETYRFTTTILHYARGITHASMGNWEAAEVEEERFAERAAPLLDGSIFRILHNCKATQVLPIVAKMLRGEIAYRKGEHATAFRELREAVVLDDNLPYDEPWGHMQPVRHALAALLLEQGLMEEAHSVYKEDLKRHPKNIWSLTGLVRCLTVQLATMADAGKREKWTAELQQYRVLEAAAKSMSEVPVAVSCFCAQDPSACCAK